MYDCWPQLKLPQTLELGSWAPRSRVAWMEWWSLMCAATPFNVYGNVQRSTTSVSPIDIEWGGQGAYGMTTQLKHPQIEGLRTPVLVIMEPLASTPF